MNTLLLRLRRPSAPPIVITLYTRAGCHLCDRAEQPTARFVAATRGATFRTVDVDSDDALRARYGVRVPVVTATVAGRETVLAEGKVSALWLRRALAVRVRGG